MMKVVTIRLPSLWTRVVQAEASIRWCMKHRQQKSSLNEQHIERQLCLGFYDHKYSDWSSRTAIKPLHCFPLSVSIYPTSSPANLSHNLSSNFSPTPNIHNIHTPTPSHTPEIFSSPAPLTLSMDDSTLDKPKPITRKRRTPGQSHQVSYHDTFLPTRFPKKPKSLLIDVFNTPHKKLNSDRPRYISFEPLNIGYCHNGL